MRSALLALALAAVLAPAAAAKPVVVASKLDRPRGLAVAPDGTLYAALVGHGGTPCNDGGGFGASGRGVGGGGGPPRGARRGPRPRPYRERWPAVDARPARRVLLDRRRPARPAARRPP